MGVWALNSINTLLEKALKLAEVLGGGTLSGEERKAVDFVIGLRKIVKYGIDAIGAPRREFARTLFVNSNLLLVDAVQLALDEAAPGSSSLTKTFFDKLRAEVNKGASAEFDLIVSSTLPISDRLGELYGNWWYGITKKVAPTDVSAHPSSDLSIDLPSPVRAYLDGYISGATVFADTNGNGKLDPGEASTTTDSNGNFTLTGGTGPLVGLGGIDLSTGLAFKGTLRAPEGSTNVDPLTTLISGLQTTGLSLASAEQRVLTAFGLPSTADLTTFDPIWGAQGGDTVSAEVYAAGAKVIDTAIAIASAFETVGKGFIGAFEDAYAALESDIKTLAAGHSLSLTDEGTIAGLINSVAKTEGVNASSFVSILSANIGASNAAIDEKLAQDGASPSLIPDVSAVQAAIQSPSFKLTKGVDTVDGGVGNDTIIATSATLSQAMRSMATLVRTPWRWKDLGHSTSRFPRP